MLGDAAHPSTPATFLQPPNSDHGPRNPNDSVAGKVCQSDVPPLMPCVTCRSRLSSSHACTKPCPPRDINDDSLPVFPPLPDDGTSEEVAPSSPVAVSPAHRGAAAVLAVAAADKAAAGGCRPSAPVGRDLLSSPKLSYRRVLLLTPVPRRLRGNKDYSVLGGAPPAYPP